MTVTTETGKDVSATKQLSGQASDSLSGKNTTTEYSNSGGYKSMGPLGGENASK
jgi:hypothetical protein